MALKLTDLAFVDRGGRRRHAERRIDVVDRDFEGLRVRAAIVVVDGDGDGVDAVVGVGVRAGDGAGGIDAGAAVGVGDARAGDRFAAVTPVDVVGERSLPSRHRD